MIIKKLLCCLTVTLLGNASYAIDGGPVAKAAAAPPNRCEIFLSSWCIQEGTFEITRRRASEPGYGRIWELRGDPPGDSRLVILEYSGCSSGVSDMVSLTSFETDVLWQGERWNRLTVQIKSDGNCILEILASPAGDVTRDWAYSSGLVLVRNCRDAACQSPSFRDLVIDRFPKTGNVY